MPQSKSRPPSALAPSTALPLPERTWSLNRQRTSFLFSMQPTGSLPPVPLSVCCFWFSPCPHGSRQECDAFLGQMKEQNNPQNSTDKTLLAASRSFEYASHKEYLMKEYGAVLSGDMPPGLPTRHLLRVFCVGLCCWVGSLRVPLGFLLDFLPHPPFPLSRLFVT
jgi:hypothetical protein